jgi:hypothetical protein
MSKRLSAEDRHAIDLLLERPDGSGKSLVEMVFAHPAKGKFEARLDAADKVLSLLDNMPAADPPEDLVSRTMQRIEQAQLEPTARPTPKQGVSRSSQRHA